MIPSKHRKILAQCMASGNPRSVIARAELQEEGYFQPKVRFGYVDPFKLWHHKVSYRKAYRYAKAMENGACFPPVHMFLDRRTGRWMVKDGAHRTVAAKMCGNKLYVTTKSLCGFMEE